MRIVQVITQMEGAGPQVQAVAMAEELRAQGLTVKTVFMYQRRGIFNKEPDTWSLLRRRPRGPWDVLKLLAMLWRVLKHEKPHAVFTTGMWSNALVPPLARLAGVRVVVATQTSLPGKLKPLPRLLDKLWGSWGIITHSVANSQTTFSQFAGYPEPYRRRLRLIEPGIKKPLSALTKGEARYRFRFPEEAPLLVHVGRLTAAKNQGALIKALPQLENVHLALVGEGEMRADCVALAHKLQLEDRVHFLGEVAPAELPHVYKAADVCVMPSLWESFGLPPVEAAAAGLPLAISNIQTFREITLLDSGEHAALFFNPQNPADIADTASRLLADETLRTTLTRRGRHLADKYDITRTTQAYVRLVSETSA
ncbi:MAG: glycosyltransferase family 4 protein [Pseudomonadaceae bacterium]|nr:glycosyltransferase family 4 protein [Pseudomonadaceae bacterium]